jgi:structural maintenance of chromosome 4
MPEEPAVEEADEAALEEQDEPKAKKSKNGRKSQKMQAEPEAEEAEEAAAEEPQEPKDKKRRKSQKKPEEAPVEEPEEAAAEEPEEAEGEVEAQDAEEPEPKAEEQVAESPVEQLVQEIPGPKKPVPRLMIKQIVLHDFKSYGGKKVIGPFHKSFSSIVGPNGSGKSNTIDALLFVFGKKASKMRLKRVSELIHSSTGNTNLPSAKVEVTFQDIVDTGDGANDYEIVPGSELTVGREAFNQSKYYLDGQTSNYHDVTTLLKKRGVDLVHNRFLILQGEVEQISLMKPKAPNEHEDGLLEYLEDIIGSNRHIEPINETITEVDKLTEVRQEKLNRLRMAEREKEALDGPRREAEAWVTAEAERLEVQALVAQFEAQQCQAGLVGLEEEHEKLKGHMAEHHKKMEGFEKEVKNIEKDHNKELKAFETSKQEMEKWQNEFKEFEKKDVKFTEDIQFQKQKLVKLQQGGEKEAEAVQKLLEDAKRLREEAPMREKALKREEERRVAHQKALDKVYAGLKDKAEALRGPKEAKEAELIPLQKKLTDVRKVVEVAQTEAQLLREKTSKVTEQIEELKSAHSQCDQRLQARQQEGKAAAESRAEKAELCVQGKSYFQELSVSLKKATEAHQQLLGKRTEVESALSSEQTRSGLIRAVYEQKKAGKLRGVHGRLGDLGTIDKKYDLAVSNGCGMLEAIVVDTTEDAQAVIDFIRKHQLGRATCICLQQIKQNEAQMNKSIKTPDGVPRLFDLIKPSKPEYAVAFYYGVRDTLVAQDYAQATKVGLKGPQRWRVVTLEGGLIETSGTMTGGGNQVRKGGMQASLCPYSHKDLEALKSQCQAAEDEVKRLKGDCRKLEDAYEVAQKEEQEQDLIVKKCELETGSLKKQMDGYDARLQSLKLPKLSADEAKKLKDLEKILSSRSDELNKIKAKHDAVEEQVRALHEQIMNIGGEELQKAQAELDESTKRCEEMRMNNKKAILDADVMEKNSKKSEANVKRLAEEYKSTEKALQKLEKEHAKLEVEAGEVLEKYSTAQKNYADMDQVLVQLREKRDAVMEAARACKRQEVDLVNEMEEKTRTLQQIHARIAGWAAKLTESRKEYEDLPLDLLAEIRSEQEKEMESSKSADTQLAQQAIKKNLSEAELSEVNRADAHARMLQLEANLKNMKPNLQSISEYRRADGEHKEKLGEYDEVNNKREDLRRKLEELRRARHEEFMSGFSIISMKLKEMYQMITLGGDAELELVDTLDPFNEGIAFSVRPPKKSWKQITNLSGGEKTLASLSLVFALHHFRPTPLYFMDEIDAALDFRNVSIIANYIKERTKDAQFIVISLRNHMFELADRVVGIYKTQDQSKCVAINPAGFEVKKPPLMDAGRSAPMPIQNHPSTQRTVKQRTN